MSNFSLKVVWKGAVDRDLKELKRFFEKEMTCKQVRATESSGEVTR